MAHSGQSELNDVNEGEVGVRSSHLVAILEKFAEDQGVDVRVEFVDADALGHSGGQASAGSILLTKGLWRDTKKLAWVYCHELAHHRLGHVPSSGQRTMVERAASFEPGSPGYRMWLAMANNKYAANEIAASRWADHVAPLVQGLLVLEDTTEYLQERCE